MEEQIFINLLQNIDNKNLSEEEKIIYMKQLLKYQNRKLKLYRDLGFDSSIGLFFIGAGIGNLIDNNSVCVPISLCAKKKNKV